MVSPSVPVMHWQNLHILRVVWTAGMLEVIQFHFMFVSFLCVTYVRACEQSGRAAQQMDKCRLPIHPVSECCWVQQRLSLRWWTWGCQRWGSWSRHSSQLMSTPITAAGAQNTEYLIQIARSIFMSLCFRGHQLTSMTLNTFENINSRDKLILI